MNVQPLNLVKSSSVDWLWPGRLALGKLALLDGDPGLGKSFVTLDLCARLSTGRPFPDGSPAPGACASVVLNAEDQADETIWHRLHALGADPARVFVARGGKAGPTDLLRLPSRTAALERIVRQSRARLVVIDPLMAFLD